MKNEKEGICDVENENDVAFPPKFRVVLLNDDYTTMEFVVEILESVFRRKHEEAVDIMLTVHLNGSGVAGIYTFDVATTRANIAMKKAKSAGFPLQCKVEPQEE